MSQAIVHIGFNKCGSTAIQKWLADNQAALANAGFAYRRTDPRPDVICSNPQFLDLAYYLGNRKLTVRRQMTEVLGYRPGDRAGQSVVCREFARDYTAWASAQGDATTLISNEHLGPTLIIPDLIDHLDAWFRKRFTTVRYIAYIRQPSPWVVSKFGHFHRNSTVDGDLDAFIDRAGLTPFGKGLAAWAATVGKERIDVRLFQESWLDTNGLTLDYCDAIGADPSVLRFPHDRVNVSFAAESRRPGWLSLLRKTPPLPPRPILSHAQYDRIAARNADTFGWIGETFFPADLDRFRDWLSSEPASQKTGT